MATANKVLGQLMPVATTPTQLYLVPAVTQANANIFAANHSASADTIRIAIVPSGGGLSDLHYIAYDMSVTGNYTLNFTGLALAAGDSIVVRSTAGTTSFTATGIEIS
jgi:hypothetical protein